MNLALTRLEAARLQLRRPPSAAPRPYRELISKIVILTMFSGLASSLARYAAETGHVTGILLLVSEALVVALTLVRRNAAIVDRTWRARMLTAFATFCPLMVRPAPEVFAPEAITILISGIGLGIVVLGKLSLGRSFGLTPANRGVVCGGLYRAVRHPIYLGYLITHAGFLAAYPDVWNILILLAADLSLMVRAIFEERTLAPDPQYAAYMQRVRWRVIPGLF